MPFTLDILNMLVICAEAESVTIHMSLHQTANKRLQISRRADLLVLSDLVSVTIEDVYFKGQLVDKNAKIVISQYIMLFLHCS